MAHAQKNPELPDGLGGEVFIGKIWSEGCRVCDFLVVGWWEVKGWCSRNLVLNLKLPFSTWVGALFSAEELKDIIMYISSGRNKDLAPLLHYCFLTVPPLFLHSLTSVISSCLNLPFGTQER